MNIIKTIDKMDRAKDKYILQLEEEVAELRKQSSEYLGKWISAQESASYRQMLLMLQSPAPKKNTVSIILDNLNNVKEVLYNASSEQLEERVCELNKAGGFVFKGIENVSFVEYK